MYWEIVVKLVLGMVFGGVIGLEREIGNRPAGFRTHTLVCMGSALVMMSAEFLMEAYPAFEPDPARLGAQVISGIGFLGAGTILKDGSRVRGLTTAASLWVVACIGLAIGMGFYWGALAATLFSYITLVLLKKFEGYVPGLRDKGLHKSTMYPARWLNNQCSGRSQCKGQDIRVNPGMVKQPRLILTWSFSRMDKQTVYELSRLDGVQLIPEND